jgi:two-component system, cell cycle sensor histidine kinase and response regulator CckA
MVLKTIISHLSRLLAALIGFALVGYIGYLVLAQYRTQLVIQDAALKQLSSDSAKRATAVSYFFSERKDDLRELAESRELAAYHENLALGMSMEYGLKASLIIIEDLAEKMRSTKLLADKPVYEQIVFIDASGGMLADTLKKEKSGAPWRRYLTPQAQGPSIKAIRRNGELKMQVCTPVHFKGKFAGEVVAWFSASQIYQYFIAGNGEINRYPVALVFEKDYLDLPAKVRGIIGKDQKSIPAGIQPLIPYKLDRTAQSEASSGSYAILVPIEGSPLSLMTFIPGGEMLDIHSPRRILYTTGGIAVFILFGMFYFQRINTSNAVLQVHLKETTLREAAVDEKNHLLAAEIEERRQTEGALRESEARFRAIVGAVPVVIYEFRQLPSGRSFSFVGDKIIELAGISAEAMVADADTFFNLLHPDDRDATLAASDWAVANDSRLNLEFRIVKPCGSIRWILANALPQGGRQGSEAVWCGCLEDITDRKQADLALRESQQQLLDIIAFLPDATLVVGKDGRVLAWNRAMEVMTGVKAEDMIGKGNYEYALPFYGERRPILIDIALHPGRANRQLYSGLQQEADVTYGEACTDGLHPHKKQKNYFAATASVLRDSKGEVTAAIECIRDSTERLLAERLLRESEATLRSLMDSMPAGVWWFNEAGDVEYLNARFADMFGYSLEEIPTVGDWLRYVYPDPELRATHAKSRDALIAEARRSGTPVPPQETVVTCRDGGVRHIIVNTQFSQGRTLEILTDITEQEFIHNELMKVQKMESLGVLAGGIAHDFNNILTGIMGNISFAQMVLVEGSEARQPLQNAEKASQRAAELAHQLLTFAKGGQPIKKIVSVRHLVKEAVSLSLRGTNVQGNITLPAELQDIEADAGQMNQAFNNIVINAAHAMSDGGILEVNGENVLLESGNKLSLPPGTYVRLDFRDEGCGIHQADLKNIFDPYFTTKSGGNGLGLASTLSIVRNHGGHILVQSEVGVGTSFTFYLPSTTEVPAPCETKKTGAHEHHAGGRVLVMDDEEMLRELSTQILSYLGYQVTTCANGEQAIELYASGQQSGTPYLAVIMDLTIPGGMGGKEAAQHILSFDPGAKLIVSSGYSNDLALSDYSNYGFCGAVVKPYKVSELADTLDSIRLA